MSGGQSSSEAAVMDTPEIDGFGVLRHRGSWMSLAPTQEAIIRVLIEHRGCTVTRAELAAATWPHGAPDHHAIDVHLHRLRPRLAKMGLVVHTLRGRGFMLESLGGEAATRRI